MTAQSEHRAARVSSPFDRSLETRILSDAAEEYGLRHGQPGTAAYRAAWLEFRRRFRTLEDLRRSQKERKRINDETVKVLNAAIERAMVLDGAPMANAQLVEQQGRTFVEQQGETPGHQPGQTLRIAVHSGFTREFLEFFETVDETASACGTALHTGRAVWVPDITRSGIFAGTPALDVVLAAGSRAVASVPITSRSGRLIGMISTHHTRPAHWDNRRRHALQQVAQAAGRVLERLAPLGPDGLSITAATASPHPG